jgi:hypothetical protein
MEKAVPFLVDNAIAGDARTWVDAENPHIPPVERLPQTEKLT